MSMLSHEGEIILNSYTAYCLTVLCSFHLLRNRHGFMGIVGAWETLFKLDLLIKRGHHILIATFDKKTCNIFCYTKFNLPRVFLGRLGDRVKKHLKPMSVFRNLPYFFINRVDEKRMGFSELVRFVLLSGMLLSVAEGNVHYYDFVVKETNFTKLCNTKSMLTVNDSFPGPVIRAHKGDTIFVNVHNQGDYGITIHWHGVKQPRNPWSDGPEYITQCPIEPGSNFTYEVILSKEEGTLWWHAHSDWTRAGVHGAIVVYPAAGTTYPFPKPDGEEIIVFGSWYFGDVNKMVEEDLITGSDTPRSDAYTINGEPGDFCNCSSETTFRRVIDYGKTYLLRLVNAVMNAELFFAIAQHNLTVVGMDGAYLKPIVTSYIMISPGQTMDILVTANQPLGYYYMAVRQFDSVRPDDTDYDMTNATAILMYRGNYTPPSSPFFPSTLPPYEDVLAAINFTKLLRSLASPEYPINVPRHITTRMYIVASMNQIIFPNNQTSLASSMNNISWGNPTTDVLLAYYRY
ncbi:hypothetical protein L1049_026534 [Liquidambar formosana]|uniref:laccase n=1 Tax=Liquidambar formosana TaxID=63359 RepID=A0AAP0R904_LIQFO